MKDNIIQLYKTLKSSQNREVQENKGQTDQGEDEEEGNEYEKLLIKMEAENRSHIGVYNIIFYSHINYQCQYLGYYLTPLSLFLLILSVYY